MSFYQREIRPLIIGPRLWFLSGVMLIVASTIIGYHEAQRAADLHLLQLAATGQGSGLDRGSVPELGLGQTSGEIAIRRHVFVILGCLLVCIGATLGIALVKAEEQRKTRIRSHTKQSDSSGHGRFTPILSQDELVLADQDPAPLTLPRLKRKVSGLLPSATSPVKNQR